MIEERLILRREDFLDLREARNYPERTSGIIMAIKNQGVIYSSGVFPRSTQKSFLSAIETVDCYELLGDLNSILIPYITGDDKDAFAQILAIARTSAGLIDEFCFVRARDTSIYTPVNNHGLITLQSIHYAIVGEKRMNPELSRFLEEQKQSINNYLSSFSSTVKRH